MKEATIGLIAGLILVPMIIICFAIAFIAHKYVETIEEHLPNCVYIKTISSTYSRAGLLGKVMRGGIIGTLLLMPSLSARRGLIDAQEVKNLPELYKNLLTIPLITGSVLFFLLLALRALVYFTEGN
ncbi:hypothetical protein D3C77_411740 [compost metagenome]